jgi:hypothetical protein
MAVRSLGCDLVVVALPGVQRLIAEARSTADVRAGSEIVARLVGVVVTCINEYVEEYGGTLVIPGEIGGAGGMPNRVVALVPSGFGASIAGKAAAEVRGEWDRLLRGVFDQPVPTPNPGVPNVLWVCVPDEGRGYRWQWEQAQRLLTARRRVRDFPEPQQWPGRAICALSARWPAEDVPPPNLKDHERATLSATNWVKRRWQHLQRGDHFPSTLSIASAGFRREVLVLAANQNHKAGEEINAAITDLRAAVARVGLPGETRVRGLPEGHSQDARWFSRSAGPWVYRERWQPRTLAADTEGDAGELHDVAERGREALERLLCAMKDHGVTGPTDYLAVIIQDLDSMGRFLSGEGVNAAYGSIAVDPEAHREVSGLLGKLAADQQDALCGAELLGVPVYLGGDDLLAFTPASTALVAAQACHDLIPSELPTASTAVLFFHYQAGLQAALTRARELLKDAKDTVPGKHALAVAYLRRSGVREHSIQPWSSDTGQRVNGRSAATMFGVFAREVAHPLSPRLVADIERDATELAALSRRDETLYRAELTRLVQRHLSGEPAGRAEAAGEAAAALLELGRGGSLARSARIGVFLRQEAR